MTRFPGLRSTELLLSTLFFVSGFAAILYQIVWQRMLFALIGINIEVVTLIVTLFIGGLGVGSLLGGIASRLAGNRLLAAFGAVELGIGLFGAVSPSLFRGLGRLAVDLDPAVVALGVAALVLPPTLAMGANTPVSRHSPGRSAGERGGRRWDALLRKHAGIGGGGVRGGAMAHAMAGFVQRPDCRGGVLRGRRSVRVRRRPEGTVMGAPERC
jgi:hypothetical protein